MDSVEKFRSLVGPSHKRVNIFRPCGGWPNCSL